MSDSLRDQLLGLGFKPAPKPAATSDKRGPAQGKPPHGKPSPGRPAHGRPQGGKPGAPGVRRDARGAQRPGGDARGPQPPRGDAGSARRGGEMDLAKAYAIRAQREKQERIEAERLKQEAARERREAKAKLAVLLQGRALNVAEADIARHFPYGGKIKRVYVTAEQLPRLNAGELGVVQMEGRYLLVDAATLAEAEALFAPAVALKVDPGAPAGDDPYADPQYQVPDDLVW